MSEIPSVRPDPLSARISKVYVLPKDDEATPGIVAALKRIAQQHNLEVEQSDGGEDGNTRVIFRGTILTVSSAADTVKRTAELAHVFASELLGDHSQKPSAT